MNRAAVIDIGSNSTKFLVGQRREDGSVNVILEGNEIVRLGEGLHETGKLNVSAMERNAKAVASFARQARDQGAEEIRCVGTMALRSAANSGEFVSLVKEHCGLDVEIISGEEEARLSYLAVLSGLPDIKEDVVVFDTGGGSTEFIYGRGREVVKRFSVNIGSVRLTETFFSDDPVKKESIPRALEQISAELRGAGVEGVAGKLVGIGGTVTTMAAVAKKMIRYDPDVIQGSVLNRQEVAAQIEAYSSRTVAQRCGMHGLQPKRADVILAGACILQVIMERLGTEELTVSDRGLRHGLAWELLNQG